MLNLELKQLIFSYSQASSEELKERIIEQLKSSASSALYEELCAKFNWDVNGELLESMRDQNKQSLATIENNLEESFKVSGETEITENLFARACHYSKVGDWENALKEFDGIIKRDKAVVGKKLDATIEKIKIFLHNDNGEKLKTTFEEARVLVEKGGDWDRKNRLKVLEGFYFLLIKDIKTSSTLFRDCVATFNCTEYCSYSKFISFVIVTSILHLPREKMKAQLIGNPHILSIVRELPLEKKLMHGIYGCNYQQFFESIISLYPAFLSDPFLHPVAGYICRELRLLAYNQFLASYKSVLLSTMATSFGVSKESLDHELSRFIANGRLSAKIDKVSDVIVTRKPDKRNTQYQEIIKKGDALLNQIQNLSRMIDV